MHDTVTCLQAAKYFPNQLSRSLDSFHIEILMKIKGSLSFDQDTPRKTILEKYCKQNE